MFSVKRRIRNFEEGGYFLLEKQYRLFDWLPVSPYMIDWPEPIYGHNNAIRAMLYKEGKVNSLDPKETSFTPELLKELINGINKELEKQK